MKFDSISDRLRAAVPIISLVTKNLSQFSRKHEWRWLFRLWIILVSQCLGMLAAEVSRTTFAVRLGDNVSLPCLDSITDVDQITWRRPGKHRNHLISDSGKFIVSNVSVADEGVYECFFNSTIVGEVELTITENVPLLESNSAHLSSETNSDSDYLRILGISTAISVFALVTLVSGIALLLLKHRAHASSQAHQLQQSPGEDESLELVPNITLNPSFNIDMLEHIEPEFNESSEHTFLVTTPEKPNR